MIIEEFYSAVRASDVERAFRLNVARGFFYPNPMLQDYVNALGCPIGCVTNKAERFTIPLLKSLGIYDDFHMIIGGDTLPAKKPDPFPLLFCAEQYKANPKHSVMVGDSVNDVQAARAAGFRILCVSYGYNHGNDIGDEGPDAVMHSLADLPTHL